MNLSYIELNSLLASYFLPFIRVSAMLLAMPIFGSFTLPARIRVLTAVVLTMVIAPTIDQPINIDLLSGDTVVTIIQQVLIGLIMGFSLQIVFHAFVLGGQVIAMQMGLGFAAMMDPQTGSNVPFVSQFYTILVTLVFFALDGHLIMISVLAESFNILPVSIHGISQSDYMTMAYWGGQMFSGAVMMALPAIAALLLVNISFGVMTRAAPQLNIFAVGFPITIVFGFSIMLAALPGLLPQIESQFESGFTFMQNIVEE
jgi:flagellar biosynthetic protein FliR